MSGSATLLKTVLQRPRSGAITIGAKRGDKTPPRLPPSATNRETKLADPERARNIEMARYVAQRAIGPDGKVMLGAENGLSNRILLEAKMTGMTGQKPTPQSQHLAKVLKQFDSDETLRSKLAAIKAPTDPGNPALGMIRATLGLAPDAPITDAHAKQAALSALTAELRQQDVGSCYGTSIAIRVHDRQPGQFLDDMNAIMTKGSLSRTIGGKTVEVPLPQQMSRGALEKPMTLRTSDGKMTKASGTALDAPVSLADTPPVVGAMTGLGIAPQDRQTSITQALKQLGRTRAGDAAIAALPASLDAKTKSIFAEILMKRLGQDIDTAEAIRGAVEAVPGLGSANRDIVRNAAKAEIDKTEVEIKPAALVRQLAMDKAGVTEADVRTLEAMRAVAAQWRAEMQNNQDGPKFKELTVEYERLQGQLDLQTLAAFEQLMVSGQDGYTGEEDNRLLRAWEYSVTQMAEIGQSQYHGDKMRLGTTSAVQSEMDRIPDFLRDSGAVDASKKPKVVAKLGEVTAKLKTEFERLYKDQIQAGYNAEIEGGKSADGSSSRGATVLYDITDPKHPWPINDAASFAKIIEGLTMNAFYNLYGKEKDEPTREAARAVAEEMARRAASERFQTAAASKTKEAYRLSGESDTDLQKRADQMKLTPWQAREGDFSEPLMKAYFGKDPVQQAVKNPNPTDAADLAGFVVSTLKGMWPAIKTGVQADPEDATVPVSGGPHAFLLTPGHPSMQEAMDSSDDPSTFLTKKFETDRQTGRGQRATPLTDGLADALLEQIVPQHWSDRDGWKAAMKSRLPPNATAADIKQAARDALSQDEFKKIVGDRAEFAIATEVPAPLAPRGPETEAKINSVMRDLQVPEGVRGTIASKVVARLGAAAAGKPSVDASAIEKVVLQALEDEGAKTAEMTSQKIQAALRKGAKPPGIVFADTNWGGGDHNIKFAIMVNPVTEQPEMVQMNEDGSGISKMDPDTWVKTSWSIATDPPSFGGI